MVSLTRYILVEGSQERPKAVSNCRQVCRGSHKYGNVVSMRATIVSERRVVLLARAPVAVMDSRPIIKLCESLPASEKLALLGKNREGS